MELKDLLGTEDKEKQIEVVQELIKAASSPVIDLVIRYENDEVTLSIMGGDISFDAIYKMLDLTRQTIHKQEIETAVQQAANATKIEEQEVEE